LRLLFKRDQGAQIAEFAAVIPMLIMMIFGILWFGRAFNIFTTVNHAAQAAARAGAAPTCATCPSGNTLPTETTIKTTVVDPIFQASRLAPPISSDFTLTHGQPLNPGGTVVGTVVTLSYPYNFKLNWLTCCPPSLTPLTLGVTINAHAQAQEEN